MKECVYLEECKNKNNILKCSKCENNPENFDAIERNDIKETVYKNPKRFYIFRDNFEEY